MEELKVSLSTIDKVKTFVSITTKIETEMDLAYNHYQVDAKSIMGILSMDLSKPLKLLIYSDSAKEFLNVREQVKEFEIE